MNCPKCNHELYRGYCSRCYVKWKFEGSSIARQHVDIVSQAMWREAKFRASIRMLMTKLKENNIELTPEEGKLIKQAMLGP